MIERFSDWEALLADYVAANAQAHFAWGGRDGGLDCALFIAGAVMAMTGFDPAKPFRGKYSSAMGSAKALKRYGAGDLESTLDAVFEVKPVGFLGRGDLVWDGEAVGLCIGTDALFIGEREGADGLYRVPRSAWVKGWAV